MAKNKFNLKVTARQLLFVGIAIFLILTCVFIFTSYTNNNQSVPPTTAKVRFVGEYKIADGEWNQIVEGKHISATKGDVTLRGYFAFFNPENDKFVGKNHNETPIALHLHHLNCKIFTSDGYEREFDAENPLIGSSSCGKTCLCYNFYGNEDTIVTILFHNPHKFGNEFAVDECLNSIAIYNGTDYEKAELKSGVFERSVGFVFVIASILILGVALFSVLLKLSYSQEMFLVGLLMLFAGVHYIFSSKSVYFWNQLVAFNTIALLLSTIMLMLTASIAIFTQLSKKVKKLCAVGVAVSLISAILCVFIPLVSGRYFYDSWPIFLVGQSASSVIVIICALIDFKGAKRSRLFINGAAVLLLASFLADSLLNVLGVLSGSVLTKAVGIGVSAIVLVLALRVIPKNINASIRAKELESEQQALKLELQRSRVSLMLSQIRPHFIYNTLGTIGEFCEEKPQKAKQLVQEFSLYLRGNFGELDNMHPIPIMQEMEHVKHYVKIENVRFPDMVMTFDLQAKDFYIPALSVQPLVENAIKHGLLKLETGGAVTVKSYETEDSYCISVVDNGVGFDTSKKIDEKKHIGIRNIRDRLRIMCDGSLTITSEVGVGTTAIISIPKETTNESNNS